MSNNNKIHVCHLVYSFDIGGLERVIANCIKDLDDEQYQHSIIALTEVGDFIKEIDKQIAIYALHKKKGSDLATHIKLYHLLKEIKPTILHSYNLATLEYQWIASLLGVSLQVHAEHGRDSYDAKGTVKRYQLLRKVMSYFVDHFICVSSDLHTWLKEDVAIDERKLLNIANGVDTDFYHPRCKNTKLRAGFAGKFIFGHVSRLHPIKNQEFMINAFYEACQLDLDFAEHCLLMLVGDGPDKQKLLQLVQARQLQQKVIFTGAQSNVRDYYSLFDVFVMTSIAEGIPMTLLESMSMKVPHLVTSVGGIKEVILNRITGEGVDNEEKSTFPQKMIALFRDKENLKKMANHSRQRVLTTYSQKNMVASYNALYQKAAH